MAEHSPQLRIAVERIVMQFSFADAMLAGIFVVVLIALFAGWNSI
jgi:hypothetical protein